MNPVGFSRWLTPCIRRFKRIRAQANPIPGPWSPLGPPAQRGAEFRSFREGERICRKRYIVHKLAKSRINFTVCNNESPFPNALGKGRGWG